MIKKISINCFLLIILLSLVLFISSCVEEDTEYLYNFTYETIGNGRIICERESGEKYHKGYFYISATPLEGEEFIGWTINGEAVNSNTGLVVYLDKDTNVIATFTTNYTHTEVTYDMNHIYANLPENLEDVKMEIYHLNSKKTMTFDMVKEDGYWSCSLVDNKISKTAIRDITFKTGKYSTQTYEYDSDYNFFNYTGIDYDGNICGGFTNTKCEMVKISVLEFNDLHGYINQSSEGRGGLSNASYLINKIRREDDEDNVVLVANGDMFQGTAISNINKGLTVVECMNQMEFDFMGIGNHEFDWNINYILNYFDGDESNGEANFPLINSNIVVKGTNKLLASDNVLESTIIEKNGIKIGVLSLIGDLSNSINYIMVKDYDFVGTTLVRNQAIKLKEAGADLIIANIHGGDADDICDYDFNKTLAGLSYEGDWLIDCIINGHTHTEQSGYIKRAGQNLPIIQAGSYCYYLGQIDLYVNKNTKDVTTSRIINNDVYLIGENYDANVQKIIDDNYKDVKDLMEEVYCESIVDVNSRSKLYNWVGNVMIASTGCDVSVCNTGGIRSTGNIKEGTKIGLEEVYMINPFDNYIVITEIKGSDIYNFLNSNNSIFYSLKSGLSLSSLRNDNKTYKLAVIDYVYYKDYFPDVINYAITDLILRDVLIDDLRLRNTFDPINDSKAYVGLMVK